MLIFLLIKFYHYSHHLSLQNCVKQHGKIVHYTLS